MSRRRSSAHSPMTANLPCDITARRSHSSIWQFLHDGLPKYSRKAVWKSPKLSEPSIAAKDNYNDDLVGILSSYNVASKEWVIRQYDHEVQGARLSSRLRA